MKKWGMAVVALAAMIVVPLDTMASTGSGGSQIACQSFAWTTTGVSTSSSSFADIAALHVTATLAEAFSVQVSANFKGQPVEVRVNDTFVGGTFALQPGLAVADPPSSGATQSFAYTWVGSNPAEHQHTFQVQWKRNSSSGTATMTRGDITVIYEGAPTPTTCS